MNRTKLKYNQKITMRKDLVARCEEFKKQLEAEEYQPMQRVILNDVGYLIREIGSKKVGATSTFKTYLRYFNKKTQEAYA
ncbi:MAG: hypothetical protein WC511_03880 [Candidatus Pacearchaeota archaeon]|jgi:hypothetical protein